MNWNRHQLTTAVIKSIAEGICKVRSNQPFKLVSGKSSVQDGSSYILSFQTEKGMSYNLAQVK